MVNFEMFVQGLRVGVAQPILEYLGQSMGYTPAPGEYPYVLAWPTQTLQANGTSGVQAVTVSQDAGFLWESTVIKATSTSLTALIRDSGQERQFMNQAVHVDLLAGTSQRPGYISLKPYYFAPNTTIQLTLTDLSGNGNAVYFALLGRRLKSDPGSFAYTQGPISRMG